MSIKTIRSKADLAIHGAVPEFIGPMHVGNSKFGNREAFLAWIGKILDNQRLTNNGLAMQELEEGLAAPLRVKHCVSICSSMIALDIAIRALGLPSEVILTSRTSEAQAMPCTGKGSPRYSSTSLPSRANWA